MTNTYTEDIWPKRYYCQSRYWNWLRMQSTVEISHCSATKLWAQILLSIESRLSVGHFPFSVCVVQIPTHNPQTTSNRRLFLRTQLNARKKGVDNKNNSPGIKVNHKYPITSVRLCAVRLGMAVIYDVLRNVLRLSPIFLHRRLLLTVPPRHNDIRGHLR